MNNFEKLRAAAISVGCEELEVCSGCGRPGCDGCPCGTHKVLVNARAEAAEAVLKRILSDLPRNRDWLDPDLEKMARALLRA